MRGTDAEAGEYIARVVRAGRHSATGPTSPASNASPSPSGAFSSPTPTAKAAALAEWPDGSEFDVGTRLRLPRQAGPNRRFGRGRFQTRLATWLVNRLVTPRAHARRGPHRAATARCRVAARAAAIANHSFE